ncbi:hypothetical protein MMAG44476_08601 [Mycolicibacterium mageritense DSM 44476 = CIP 104973]|uniref:TIGR03085 family protein n=2 Tax=Mycobacteriaceae TaxID=1762 RepID=A0ABM7HQM3_MYCME|nr:TIGR03085 family metal-binding protein [Mycolicibacterium mageritense]MBN3459052.1 TIGR03085 family protein [Mycobacterium sp. DSM 3803]MCC9183580.1 TIGR03085 family metal-binding protein [Mycolicibacterium mageritense]BBX32822.1 TIGR03085 family protein [Mycolicibacterium mageritense]
MFDIHERRQLCDLFEAVGADAPTLIKGWTACGLAAHLVLRERDRIGGPCLVLPGRFQRFAERRRIEVATSHTFEDLVALIRSGPPPGFFRLGIVRRTANLNEFFVHHEDVRRANGLGPRVLSPEFEAALWRNIRHGSRYLCRRLSGVGLEIDWAGTDESIYVHPGEPIARLSGTPGELLLYLFGRQAAAQVHLSGHSEAVAAVCRAHLEM